MKTRGSVTLTTAITRFVSIFSALADQYVPELIGFIVSASHSYLAWHGPKLNIFSS